VFETMFLNNGSAAHGVQTTGSAEPRAAARCTRMLQRCVQTIVYTNAFADYVCSTRAASSTMARAAAFDVINPTYRL
jgi:hypothetical protein